VYLRIDHHTGEPIYRQIVEQIKYMVACGRLAEGARLPSIRELGRDLRINPRTVVKAYEELQNAGLVVMRHGQGAFIATNRGHIPAGARRKAIGDLARRLLAEASRMGATPAEVLEIVEDTAGEMYGETKIEKGTE
jgi:GntR family transcriptional regulator